MTNKRKKEYATDVLKREIEERKKKLNPCPFCNGEAEVGYRLGLCSVVCKDCGARVSSFGDVNPAIEAWNKRVDVAKSDECCEKSCKKENATCKENLQLTRSDIEKMVKLEWRDNRPMVADCGDFSLNIFYMRENEYTIYASKGILGGEMYIGTTKSEDEAKQKAKSWVVDLICSALGVEE